MVVGPEGNRPPEARASGGRFAVRTAAASSGWSNVLAQVTAGDRQDAARDVRCLVRGEECYRGGLFVQGAVALEQRRGQGLVDMCLVPGPLDVVLGYRGPAWDLARGRFGSTRGRGD